MFLVYIKVRVLIACIFDNLLRYYSHVDDMDWPPEVRYYNEKFTKLIEAIKRRHDPVVTTVVCD